MGLAFQCDVCNETFPGRDFSHTKSSVTRDFFSIQLDMTFSKLIIPELTQSRNIEKISICKNCVKQFLRMAYDIDFSDVVE